MAGPRTTTNRPKRPPAIKCIGAAALALVIVAAIMIILWLVLHPAKPRFSVDHAAAQGFNFTGCCRLNGTFELTVRVYNPNKHASVHYDSVAVAVWFSDLDIANAGAAAFHQPPQNETRLDVAAPATPLALPLDLLRDVKKDRSAGKMAVEVRVRARVRFQVSVVKTRRYIVRARCSPVAIDFAAPSTFDRVYCDVDI